MKLLWCAAVCAFCFSLGAARAAPQRKIVQKPQPKPARTKPALIVVATVRAATKPPRPRSVPYKDAVISLHLVGIRAASGAISTKAALVFLWGMRDNKWTTAASYRAGQVVKLRLIPWEKVERKYDSYNRFEVPGQEVLNLPIYWAQTG